MIIVRPATIDDTTLISTSVPETDYSEYVAGTTYDEDDYVIVVADHKIYQSLQNSNTGHTPSSSPTWWVEVSATNAWKMFDGRIGLQTSNSTSIVLVIEPGVVDTIAFLNTYCDSIQVVSVVDGSDVYDQTISGFEPNVFNLWDYLTEPIIYASEIIFEDIPLYYSNEITITMLGSTVLCGECVIGQSKEMGDAKWGVKRSIADYTVQQEDDFGNLTLVEGNYYKKMFVDFFTENLYAREIERIVTQYRATPVLWVPNSTYTNTIVFGIARNFDYIIESPAGTNGTFEIRGLI